MQAAWHALQPMQRVTSISLATSWSCRRTDGGVIVVAEMRMKSCDCKLDMSVPYATGAATFSTLTRNALNSGVCVLASPTEGVSVFAP